MKNSNTRVPVQIPASTGSTASRFDNTDGVRLEAPFDRILLDVPCSNTGVLRRRVDVRWRLTEEDFIRMPVQQAALVRRALPLLKPGGTLVYSTCSLEPEENERLVAQLLQAHPELLLKETRQTLPFRDGIDGAFAARFQLREA